MGAEKSLPRYRAGYTLTELMIVVTILAIVAAIVVPATVSTDSARRLRLVAEEFAGAIRFARSESIRTGEPHGFEFFPSQHRIQVFSADSSASPWVPVWDVRHPVSKQLHDYGFPPELVGAATPVTHAPLYRSVCTTVASVYFDARGTPWCLEPENVLLDSYRLDLTTNDGQMSVNLDGITGRVTVQ